MINKIVSTMAVVTLLFLSLFILLSFIVGSVSLAFSILVWTGAILFVIGGICLLSFFGLINYEKYMSIREERLGKEQETRAKKALAKAEERKAEVITIVGNDGSFYYSDLNKDADWVARHRHPAFRVNGIDHEPTKEEIENWYHYNKPSQKIIEGKFQQLEAGEKNTSYYDLLKDYPHLMLLGATNSGKTTQIVSAIEYRLKQYPNAALVWLSTHAKMDNVKIPSKAVVFNHAEDIASVLQDLFATYTKRREGGSYKQIIIAIDEWPEIVDELKDLGVSGGDILRRLSRGGRKTGFSLILASHGATVSDLDTQGHSSVKQDFAQVYLDKSLTRNGRAIWQQFDKKSSRIEITLPEIVQVELTDNERKIIDLHNSGLTPYQIAKEVYKGKPGGNQLSIVKDTINKS